MKVLVTGATGYLGSRVVHVLVEEGHEVRVMTRSWFNFAVTVDQVNGNLADTDSLARVTNGVEAVLHLGGGMRPSDGDLQEVNVVGTKRLMEESINSGVQRFIYMSAAAVYGDIEHPPATEQDECHPIPGHLYATSKLSAEHELLQLSGQGTEVVILRPAQVYSADSHSIRRFPKLASLIDGNHYTHFVHREDVVRAALWVLGHPEARGVYNVADEHPLTVREAREVIQELTAPKDNVGNDAEQSIPPMLRRIMESTLVLDTHRIRGLGFQIRYGSLKQGILYRW